MILNRPNLLSYHTVCAASMKNLMTAMIYLLFHNSSQVTQQSYKIVKLKVVQQVLFYHTTLLEFQFSCTSRYSPKNLREVRKNINFCFSRRKYNETKEQFDKFVITMY